MKFSDQALVLNTLLNVKSPDGGLTEEMKQWAYDNVFHHIAYYYKTKAMRDGRLICMDCLKEFNTANTSHGINEKSQATVVCPHCGRTLVVERTKRTTYSEYVTFARNETVDGVSVKRIYECYRTRNINQRGSNGVIDDYLSHDRWCECVRVFMNGKATEYASLPLTTFCWSKSSPWRSGDIEYVRKTSKYTNRQSYISDYAAEEKICSVESECDMHSNYIYDIYEMLKDELKAVARKKEIINKIITYPMFETLVKAGQIGLAAAIVNRPDDYYNYRSRIVDYMTYYYRQNKASLADMFAAAKICIRNHYIPEDPMMYLDYLDDLSVLHKDFHNAHYVCPANLKEAHALTLNTIRNRVERERAKRDEEANLKLVEQARQHDEEYRQKKAAYLDIAFDIPEVDLHISVIPSASAMQTEGNCMHHCVGRYWNYENSLILSCRRGKKMERHATIEINLKTFKVAQVRAAYNGVPEYLQLINICLERNMDVIRKAYNEQQKINKRIEEEIERMKKAAMAVAEKKDRLPQCTHALMGMAI